MWVVIWSLRQGINGVLAGWRLFKLRIFGSHFQRHSALARNTLHNTPLQNLLGTVHGPALSISHLANITSLLSMHEHRTKVTSSLSSRFPGEPYSLPRVPKRLNQEPRVKRALDRVLMVILSHGFKDCAHKPDTPNKSVPEGTKSLLWC